MSLGQDTLFPNGPKHLRLRLQSFSPLKNHPPSQAANTKIKVHPDRLMKTNGLPQKQGNPHLRQSCCASAKKSTEGPRMCMKTKGELSDILEGPTMLMKTKGLISHSYHCLRGRGRSSGDKPPGKQSSALSA